MVFVVVLLTGEQLVRIIDIIEIQVQGRCRWMLEIGGILPLLAVDRVVVGRGTIPGYSAGANGDMAGVSPAYHKCCGIFTGRNYRHAQERRVAL